MCWIFSKTVMRMPMTVPERVFKTFVGITMVFTKVISKLSQWQDFAVVKKPSTALWQNLLNALVNLEVCPRV